MDSVSASHAVGSGTHGIDSAARLSNRSGRMWNSLWGYALKLYWDQSQRYGIVSQSRISSAKCPSIPKKHYNGLINLSTN